MGKPKTIRFADHPDFTPNLTPRQMFQRGVFGGTYWRPIYSSVVKKNLSNQHHKFPKSWWAGIPEDHLSSPHCDPSRNKYKVHSGTSLRYWESKHWITHWDPYGWVQWYCHFYQGRRLPGEDERQIERWQNFTGPTGRFRKRLVNMVKKHRSTYDDYTISPVIRQALLQWAYELTPHDIN